VGPKADPRVAQLPRLWLHPRTGVGRRNAGQWRIASAQRIGRRSVLEQAEVDLSKLDTLEAVVANGRLYPREDLDAGPRALSSTLFEPLVPMGDDDPDAFCCTTSEVRDQQVRVTIPGACVWRIADSPGMNSPHTGYAG